MRAAGAENVFQTRLFKYSEVGFLKYFAWAIKKKSSMDFSMSNLLEFTNPLVNRINFGYSALTNSMYFVFYVPSAVKVIACV